MKASKVKIVIWSCVAVLTVALFIVLLINPSIFKIDFSGFRFGGLTAYVYDNASAYTAGNTEIDAAKVNSIDAEWTSGNIEIVTGATGTVKLEEANSADLSEKESVHWYLSNGVLKIRFAASGITVINKSKQLKITVPEGFAVDKLDVEIVSADFSASGIAADALDIEAVSGTIDLDSVTGNDLDIETVSGKVTGKNLSFENVGCDSISGKVSLDFAIACPSSADFESVSGAVDLMIPEDSGFTAKISSVSGDISTDFPCVFNSKTCTCGDGSAKFQLDSVSGDLTIKKR